MSNTASQGRPKRETHLSVLLLTPVIIWSTVFPLSKLVLGAIPPTSLAALRFSVGSVCLLGYAVYVFSSQEVFASLRRRWKTYLVLGFIGIFMNNFLQNLGLNLSTASSTSLLGTTDPIFAVLLSAVILGEPLTKRKVLGLLAAFIGVYFVTTNGQWFTDWGQSSGNLLVIGAALSYSIYTILSKQVLHHEEPPIVVAWTTTIGALGLAVVALILDRGQSWGTLTTSHKLIIAYLSVVPTSVSVVAYFYLLQRIQASQAAVTLFLIPVFSIIWSVALLGEVLTPAMIVGGVLIISGVWLTMIKGRSAARPKAF
ncbi:MAG: DMT family transporter [Peptococcaceae bacterium]|nr:DMT family transporter [Peptococcaceae bacterium]